MIGIDIAAASLVVAALTLAFIRFKPLPVKLTTLGSRALGLKGKLSY